MHESENLKISIIIPVYNVEQYLPQCIESCINQSYHNLEIILVNDGSPDNSGKICDEYAQKDQRIRVIHKENGGVSSARNKGILNSTGEYIYFVDADDFIEPDLLETCLKSDRTTHADIIIFGFNKVNINGLNKKTVCPSPYTITNLDNEKSKLAEIFISGTGLAVWDKLIKAGLIKEHSILFDNKKRGQDFAFVVKCLTYTNSLRSVSKAGYNYRIITGVFNKYDQQIIENHLENYLNLYQFFRQTGKFNIKTESFLNRLFVLWFTVVIPLNIANAEVISFWEKLRKLQFLLSNSQIKHWKKEVKPGLLSVTQRIMFINFQLSIPIFLFLQAKFITVLRKAGFRN